LNVIPPNSRPSWSRNSEHRRVPPTCAKSRSTNWRQIEEILQHLSEWLLTKTGDDIEQRFFELGERRASQGVTLSDPCWAIAVIKEHLWEFLERQGFKRGPVEIYGEVELLRLLDRFLDRALCFATEGYEQPSHFQD
jgi:hypothetical protein